VARESIFCKYYWFYFGAGGAEGMGGKDPLMVKADPKFPGILAIIYTPSMMRSPRILGITIE
jgi:hypothetical protein